MRTVNSVKIEPAQLEPWSSRTGTLRGLTMEQITTILGFEPNITDDDETKVRWSWGFTLGGSPASVWDYKGSADLSVWSTDGPAEEMLLVFGRHYQTY